VTEVRWGHWRDGARGAAAETDISSFCSPSAPNDGSRKLSHAGPVNPSTHRHD